MKKEEFLSLLRKKLSILNEEEVNDIINEYSEHIDQAKKKKKKEEDIIEEFGDIDELVKDILGAYKINQNYKKNKYENKFLELSNTLGKVVKKIGERFETGSVNEIIRFIVELLVILLLILLMKIPFEIVRTIGAGVLDIAFYPIDEVLTVVWNVFVNLMYIIISFFVFVGLFKRRYLKESEEDMKEKEVKKETKTKTKAETKKTEEVKVEKVTTEKNKSGIDTIADLIIILIKVFVVICSIPFAFSLIGLFIALIFSGFLIPSNIIFVGITIGILGLVVGNIWFLELVYDFVFKRKANLLRIFITFIIALILIAFGICFTMISAKNFEYIDSYYTKAPLNYTTKVQEFTKEIKTNTLHINCDNCDIDKNSFVIDNTLGNKVLIKVEYYSNITNLVKTERENCISLYTNVEFKGIYNQVINDLKDSKVYNYENYFEPIIKVYVSDEYKDRVIVDGESYYEYLTEEDEEESDYEDRVDYFD